MLSPVSLYGVRLYHNGSILAPHVDRMPLVTSCISKFGDIFGDVLLETPRRILHTNQSTNTIFCVICPLLVNVDQDIDEDW